MRHPFVTFLGVALLATMLSSCGGASTPSSPSAGFGTAGREVTSGTMLIGQPAEGFAYFDLVTVDTARGKLEATVDWQKSSNTLWMWVTDGACTEEQFENPACPHSTGCACKMVASSEVSSPKPRVLTVPSASSGAHTLIILNLGPGQEEAKYSVTLAASQSLETGEGSSTVPMVVTGRGKKRLSSVGLPPIPNP